ncbi:hypothetical protein D3C84_380700 [compost metagenome]
MQRQAADGEHLGEVAETGRLAHRRIVEQHIAQGARLLILNGLGGVADHAEGDVFDRALTQHTQVGRARHLASAIGIVLHGAGDGGRAQFQCLVVAHQWRQGIAVAAGALQCIAATLEQLGEPGLYAVAALQAWAGAVVEQFGVERQWHAGHRGELCQHITQGAGGDRVVAGCGAFHGVGSHHRVHGRQRRQGHGQAQRLHGQAWGAHSWGAVQRP